MVVQTNWRIPYCIDRGAIPRDKGVSDSLRLLQLCQAATECWEKESQISILGEILSKPGTACGLACFSPRLTPFVARVAVSLPRICLGLDLGISFGLCTGG